MAYQTLEHLIYNFLTGELSADEFSSLYCELHLSGKGQVYDQRFLILDELFAVCDMYSSDPLVRAELPQDIDENRLRAEVEAATTKLSKL